MTVAEILFLFQMESSATWPLRMWSYTWGKLMTETHWFRGWIEDRGLQTCHHVHDEDARLRAWGGPQTVQVSTVQYSTVQLTPHLRFSCSDFCILYFWNPQKVLFTLDSVWQSLVVLLPYNVNKHLISRFKKGLN